MFHEAHMFLLTGHLRSPTGSISGLSDTYRSPEALSGPRSFMNESYFLYKDQLLLLLLLLSYFKKKKSNIILRIFS